MTLSNFDWTDKTSVRWFLLLASGHEGPYSLEYLVKRGESPLSKIWAETLSFPVTLEYALNQANQANQANKVEESQHVDEDEIPPLPPLPVVDEEEISEEIVEDDQKVESIYEEYERTPPVPSKGPQLRYLLPFIIFGLILLGIASYEWTQGQKEFSLRRPPGMSVEIHDRILRENKVESWSKKLFLKEYIPSDLSQIWLVTTSFHACDVQAKFESEENKLLSEKELKVTFQTKGKLKDHLVTFDEFNFDEGVKIIPGLYKMNLTASNCEWTSFLAKLMNGFSSPDKTYESHMSVVLYHKGAQEFNEVLDKLLRRKLESQIKAQNQEDLFWQDLQQKLQTLQAVVLQIEQLFLDFTSSYRAKYSADLKEMVNTYTKNYGGFLTDFVVANEKYFQELDQSKLNNLSKKRTYEKLVNMTAKNLGFEAMKLIEELQTKKSLNKAQREVMQKKIRDNFSRVKQMIGNKIIQITEDQANPESEAPPETDLDQSAP